MIESLTNPPIPLKKRKKKKKKKEANRWRI
jgi:hypothetical protein